MAAKKDIVEQLRRAILDSGETEYAIAKATGVSQSVLNRFVKDERGISLKTAARLCSYLRLSLASK
jgi:plasmid maintenance system antidote protein VapI